MYVLRVFRLCRTKEQETGHAQLCNDVSKVALFVKSQRDALTVSRHPFQPRTAIPPECGQPLTNDIRSPNPTVVELRTEEMSPYLLSHDFGFRQFRHERGPSSVKWLHTPYQAAKQLIFMQCPL
jgi:hypothetical protein